MCAMQYSAGMLRQFTHSCAKRCAAAMGSNGMHMVQEVQVAHHNETVLHLESAGPHPVRYFTPVNKVSLDDTSTDAG